MRRSRQKPSQTKTFHYYYHEAFLMKPGLLFYLGFLNMYIHINIHTYKLYNHNLVLLPSSTITHKQQGEVGMSRSNGIDLEKNSNMKKAKTSNGNLYPVSRPTRYMFTNNQDYDIVLKYRIHHAEGLDNPNIYPLVTNRIYSAESWIETEEEKLRSRTTRVWGLPNPVWDEDCCVKLDRFWDIKLLHVEVLRHGSWSEPGTSNGIVCVGRAQIPLPKELLVMKSGRFGLVRLVGGEKKGEGHVGVSMELTCYC